MQCADYYNDRAAELRAGLNKIASSNCMALWGVADLEKAKQTEPDLLSMLADAPVTRAFVMALRLHKGVLYTIEGGPNALYMHHYKQVNYRLDRTALEVGEYLERHGYLAIAVAASQIVTKKPMTGHISHRTLAQAAGLGWRGRNNLLVTEKFGAQVRLVSVLTDAPLLPDSPVEGLHCGKCRACVSACPAKAIGESPDQFNLEACYAKLTEFTRIPFVSQHICGVCQKVCDGRVRSGG